MSTSRRPRTLTIVATTALASLLAATAAVPIASGLATVHARDLVAAPAPLRARVTGMPIGGTSSAAAPAPAPRSATALPSKAQQIRVLDRALGRMQKDYGAYEGLTPGPQDVWDYGVGKLWQTGIDGAGTTVAVIEGWDYPGIGRQVASFDKVFGLPNPNISTIFPAGKLPARCPAGMVALGGYGSCRAWKGELALDVISAHLMAPYANIVISATPADTEIRDDAASQVAPPEMMEAVETISRQHLANVISISDGTGEITYSRGAPEIRAQDPGELAAAAAGIPVAVATGDCGVVQNLAVANGQCEDTSKGPDTAAWDDSPWVTAVGGSVPNLDSHGKRLGHDPIWHVGGRFGEGAGFSSVYERPSYQNGVASVTRSPMRSVPDITMDAQDGTSEAAPLFAGILALATQLNRGADIGPIDPALYGSLGPRGTGAGIADVISGDNSYETSSGKVIVPGFVAGPGFDVASGWGTILASRFVPALVVATRRSHEELAARRQAAGELGRLEHVVTLSPDRVPQGGTTYLGASGFLPRHPVELEVDGRRLARLRADVFGRVAFMLDPAALGLSPGTHVVTLDSMLVTVTRTFVSS